MAVAQNQVPLHSFQVAQCCLYTQHQVFWVISGFPRSRHPPNKKWEQFPAEKDPHGWEVEPLNEWDLLILEVQLCHQKKSRWMS